MKLQDALAPKAWRVQAFLAEKGIGLSRVPHDVMTGEVRSPEFRKLNSLGEVPLLELDDGTLITESIAICAIWRAYIQIRPCSAPLRWRRPRSRCGTAGWSNRSSARVRKSACI